MSDYLNVQDFGAKSGSGDDTSAFKACADAILATADQSTGDAGSVFTTENTLRKSMFIPNGDYLITSPGVFIDTGTTGNLRGYDIAGESMAGTKILYQPSQAGAMFEINGSLMFGRVSNLTFGSDDNVKAKFWHSDADDGTGSQNFLFDRVQWYGSWERVFHLNNNSQGGTVTPDNNSEHHWSHCRISLDAGTNAFLYSEGTDQQVTYSFYGTSFWSNCPWLHFITGGNISLTDCDAIFNDSNSGPYYLFNMLGTQHSDGGSSFSVNNMRVEHRHVNARLLLSEWSQGNINITNYNGTALASVINDQENITINLKKNSNASGPIVKIQGSNIPGYVSIEYNEPYRRPGRIVIDSSTAHHKRLSDLVRYTGTALPRPNVEISDSSRTKLNDLLLHWKFGELTDNTVKDYTRHNSPGTHLKNGVASNITATTGQNGVALLLNGSDEWVNLGSVPGSTPNTIADTNVYSALIKFRVDGGANNRRVLFETTGNFAISAEVTAQDEIKVWASRNQPPGGVADISVTVSGLTIEAGVWYTLGVTYDGTNLLPFVNGIAQTSSNELAATLKTITGINIGANRNNVRWFNGALDDFRLYCSVLSAEEMMAYHRNELLTNKIILDSHTQTLGQPSSDTKTNLENKDASVNNIDKYAGKLVWSMTDKVPVYAEGNANIDKWLDSQGSIKYSPV